MCHQARLVVRRTPTVEAAVAFDRLERIASPQPQVSGGLDVVVRVEQHGGTSGGAGTVTEHGGLPARPDDLGTEAAGAQQGGDRGGGALQVMVVEAVVGDAGDSDQPFQVGANAGHLVGHGGAQLVVGR